MLFTRIEARNVRVHGLSKVQGLPPSPDILGTYRSDVPRCILGHRMFPIPKKKSPNLGSSIFSFQPTMNNRNLLISAEAGYSISLTSSIGRIKDSLKKQAVGISRPMTKRSRARRFFMFGMQGLRQR